MPGSFPFFWPCGANTILLIYMPLTISILPCSLGTCAMESLYVTVYLTCKAWTSYPVLTHLDCGTCRGLHKWLRWKNELWCEKPEHCCNPHITVFQEFPWICLFKLLVWLHYFVFWIWSERKLIKENRGEENVQLQRQPNASQLSDGEQRTLLQYFSSPTMWWEGPDLPSRLQRVQRE